MIEKQKEVQSTKELLKELQILKQRVSILQKAEIERKWAKEEVRKLTHAVEQSPASIIITDTLGSIEYVNPKFTSVTGYKYEEVIGKNPRILKSGEIRQEEYKQLWEMISSGREWRGEFHNKKKNGELYWESASISSIRDNDGVIVRYLAIKEDITEKKKTENLLQNRVKELNCLFSISEIRGKSGLTQDKMLKKIVNIIPSSWQYPDCACAKIVLSDKEYTSKGFQKSPCKQEAIIKVDNKKAGRISVYYSKSEPKSDEGPFLKEESKLLNTIAERVGRIIEHELADKKLRESETMLQEQNVALEQKNSAFKELIEQIELEKHKIKERVIDNVDKIIKPTLKRLKIKERDLTCREYVAILEKNLEELVSPFGYEISRQMQRLTPMEIQICNMVKSGLKSKEIACILSVSPLTVDTHRNFIRKKLGISRKGINLTSYLQTL